MCTRDLLLPSLHIVVVVVVVIFFFVLLFFYCGLLLLLRQSICLASSAFGVCLASFAKSLRLFFTWFYWVSMALIGFCLVLLGSPVLNSDILGFPVLLLNVQGFLWYLWALVSIDRFGLGFTGFYRVSRCGWRETVARPTRLAPT